jgi:hypothetical protein
MKDLYTQWKTIRVRAATVVITCTGHIHNICIAADVRYVTAGRHHFASMTLPSSSSPSESGVLFSDSLLFARVLSHLYHHRYLPLPHIGRDDVSRKRGEHSCLPTFTLSLETALD